MGSAQNNTVKKSARSSSLQLACADLLRRLVRPAEAAAAYRQALELAATDAERRYLARRLAETTGKPWPRARRPSTEDVAA